MKSYQDASLGNVVLGIASLAILYVLINRARPEGGVFWNIGYFKPINQVKNFLFVKPALILRSARDYLVMGCRLGFTVLLWDTKKSNRKVETEQEWIENASFLQLLVKEDCLDYGRLEAK